MQGNNPKLSDGDFKRFSELVYEKTGINLHEGKKQLLQSRVNKIMRQRGLTSYREYYDLIVRDKTDGELIEFINVISTNVTYFFREEKHFEFLRGQWRDQLAPGRDAVEVWSAACSTGEEVYSLCIELSEVLGSRPYHILGSDISTKVLKIAEKGIYSLEKLTGVNEAMLKRYFQRGTGTAEGYVRVKKDLRDRTSFRIINLVEEIPLRTQYDLIVCRNVMIYFDSHVKNRIVNKLENCIKPGGYLFIGHSESLNGLSHDLQYVAPAIYRKKAF